MVIAVAVAALLLLLGLILLNRDSWLAASYAVEKRGSSWLRQHNFIIFIHVVTKLDDVHLYILLTNSTAGKTSAKNVHVVLKYEQKSQGLFFISK